jgi:hypothetical protein
MIKEKFDLMRQNLKAYGIKHKTGRELSDEEILGVADKLCTGFVLMVNKVQELQEEMSLIFSVIGDEFEKIDLVIDETQKKKNMN